MTRPVVDGPLRERLLPLVERLPVERQGLEAGPALLFVEPAPRQQQPGSVNAVVYADVGRDKASFDRAKARVRAMDLRWIEEADPVQQTLLEVYAAIRLGTPHNDFDTH